MLRFFARVQQFFDSRFFLFGAVQPEIQFRRTPQAQTLDQFVANIFARRFQTLETLVGILVVAFHVHPDLRRTAIVRDMNRRHAHQADARIGQFAFDQRFDLFAQGLADPPAMIFEPALLHDSGTSGKTHENIRKSGASV